eukprot:scaffold48943_cov68-Cyclotella_meneghiniana.AAC.1
MKSSLSRLFIATVLLARTIPSIGSSSSTHPSTVPISNARENSIPPAGPLPDPPQQCHAHDDETCKLNASSSSDEHRPDYTHGHPVTIQHHATNSNNDPSSTMIIEVCTNHAIRRTCTNHTDDTSMPGHYITPRLSPGQLFPIIRRDDVSS